MTELHVDPRMPPVDEVVLRPLLEKRAQTLGDKTYAWFDSGQEWSYRETRRRDRQRSQVRAGPGMVDECLECFAHRSELERPDVVGRRSDTLRGT